MIFDMFCYINKSLNELTLDRELLILGDVVVLVVVEEVEGGGLEVGAGID
jgi:hypothetical protein